MVPGITAERLRVFDVAGLVAWSQVEIVGDLVNWIGGGFHPDTPFASYMDYAEPMFGVPTFTDEQANILDGELEAAIHALVAGIEVYEVCLDELHKLHAEEIAK